MFVANGEISDDFQHALAEGGIADLYALFVDNDIDAEVFLELNEGDFRELGLTLGQRKRSLRVQAALGAAPTALAATQTVRTAPAAERRQLTVLFCDLVGSTQLATLLDPEDLRDVIASYHRTCRETVARHGGHVAYSQGDGLMVYFGFPFAREDDPVRALRAALETARRVAELGTLAPEPLRVRIGVATGRVVVGDLGADGSAQSDMVVGETPNLAARLQQSAEAGEIVTSGTTRRLAGPLFAYGDRGSVTLKGFPEPVPVWRVLGETQVESRFEARTSGTLGPMVGRQAERAALETAWAAAMQGAGRVVLVSGDAGIGKSRLVRAFFDTLVEDRCETLEWYCSAYLENRPLHPVSREIERSAGLLAPGGDTTSRRQRLRAFVEAAPGLDAGDDALLVEFLGQTGETGLDLDANTRARRLFDLLARRVEGAVQVAPVAILLEDAHWADALTIEFLTLLMQRITSLPVLLIIAHRPEFEPPWPPSEMCSRIALGRLDSDAGAELLGLVVRERALPPDVVRTILEKADGVPLFVEELTKTMLEAVRSHDASTGALSEITVPDTLTDSLMARLDRLAAAKEIAQLGAVIGREFSADMLRVIAPNHPDPEGGLRQLCEAGLAAPTGEDASGAVVFHHALIQETAYESLLRRRRQEVHRAIADAMLSGNAAFPDSIPEVLARHCSLGGLPVEAVAHWLAAGRHALDRAAGLPAINHLRAALDLLRSLPEGPERSRTELEIQMALAPATMAINGWASPLVEQACTRARDLATETGDHAALFGAVWGLWTNFFIRGEMDPALETAQSVAQMAKAEGGPMLAMAAGHALLYSHYSRGEYAEALAAAEQGLSRYDAEADRIALRAFQLSPGTALRTLACSVRWFMGDTAGCDAEMARAHEMAVALNHPPALAHCLCVSSFTLMFRRDWERLEPVARRALALSEAEGFRFWEPMARMYVTLAEAGDGGDVQHVDTIIGAMDQFRATGANLTLSQFEPSLSEMLMRLGMADRAAARLDELIAEVERRAEHCYLPELYRVRGEARLACGDPAAAGRDLARALALAERQRAVPLIARAKDSLAALTDRSNLNTDDTKLDERRHGAGAKRR